MKYMGELLLYFLGCISQDNINFAYFRLLIPIEINMCHYTYICVYNMLYAAVFYRRHVHMYK